MKRAVAAIAPETLSRTYPISGKLPDWYFRITETSNNAWKVEGCDVWGRKVARDGGDTEAVLAACVADARAIAAASR